MARPSPTVLLLLLLSFLAVASCRTIEADPANDASTVKSTAVVAVSDETGPPNPTLPYASGATEVVPEEQHGFLRLPSHRRPCGHGLFHRHLWWPRHHGVFRGKAEEQQGKEASEADEVKPVAEPDPDRSLPESDGEGEVARRPFRHGGDGGDGDAAVLKHWRKEMLRRMFRHGLRHHLHHHHHHHEEEDDQEQEAQGGAAAVKRFRHHDDEEDKEEKKMRKLFHHHEDEEEDKKLLHHVDADDSDSDDEDDEELEDMVRRFRREIARRRFSHGRFFRHHHGRRHHHHADGEQQEGAGVMTWIKGLMNRF